MAVAEEDPPPSSANLPASTGNLAANTFAIPAHQAYLDFLFPIVVDLFPLLSTKFIP